MYFNIYQISNSLIRLGDYIDEMSFIEHWFTNEIAEKVVKVNDPDDERRMLLELFEQKKIAVSSDDRSFTILPNGKENYFKDAFQKFCNTLQKIEGGNLSDFANGKIIADLMYQLNKSFCDKFGAYVALDCREIIPFDEFIRSADCNSRYYIGAVLQYKY